MSVTDQSQDLGVFDNNCLIFGGPYSNLQATQAVLAQAKMLGISSERTICTGDVVAYCADPQATVDLIHDSGIHVVMGNCEESLALDSSDCGCGYKKGSACELLAIQWYRYSSNHLSPGSKRWMGSLPRFITFEMSGRKLKVIHGGVSEISKFIFPSTPMEVKREELHAAGVDGVIGGHSGVPFSQFIGNRIWHNAGVIGMPANDGTPRVWYSVLQPEDEGVRIEHRELSYDFETAAQNMHANGLSEQYICALKTGLWPSDDVMPSKDRNARGVHLQPNVIFWHILNAH